MSTRVWMEKSVGDRQFVMEKSSLGQVTEYDVYEVTGGERKYLGGGSKRESYRLWDKVGQSSGSTVVARGRDGGMVVLAQTRRVDLTEGS